jgi:hypothetical protein
MSSLSTIETRHKQDSWRYGMFLMALVVAAALPIASLVSQKPAVRMGKITVTYGPVEIAAQ